MSFADACYDNQRLRDTLESVIWRCVRDFANKACDDSKDECQHDSYEYHFIKRLDPYDDSIEFWAEPGAELSEFEQDCLWVLGFRQCWVCYIGVPHDAPREQREKFYWNKAKGIQ